MPPADRLRPPANAPGTAPGDAPGRTPGPAPLPGKAAQTTAERPWPVRMLSMKMADYIDKMSALWVEGQVVELSRRSGSLCFLTLRDPDVDMSLTVTISGYALDAMTVPLRSGQRVVVQAKPTFWPKRGTLQLEGRQIRPVGEGELLARVEHLKRVLAAEGVFDRARKRRLPFLPEAVGLICGRGSAAERDVVENARRRWPAVRFEIREVPVQGSDAVLAVAGALAELDGLAHVQVIVIARGGGSFEDLLPFSNETMVRAVAAARTPVVSAIGHDVDTPLLDFVADVRASTPTDAAKCIVPDGAEERTSLADARRRLTRAVRARLAEQRRQLAAVRSRPVLRNPAEMLAPYRRQIHELRSRAERTLLARTHRAADEVGHLRARVRALSPLATLYRGYAVVEHADGRLVAGREAVTAGELVRIRLADGDFGARVVG